MQLLKTERYSRHFDLAIDQRRQFSEDHACDSGLGMESIGHELGLLKSMRSLRLYITGNSAPVLKLP